MAVGCWGSAGRMRVGWIGVIGYREDDGYPDLVVLELKSVEMKSTCPMSP